MAQALFNESWNVEEMAYLLNASMDTARVLGGVLVFPDVEQSDFDSFLDSYEPTSDWINPDFYLETMKQRRQAAYVIEADPLYFGWQRSENTEQDWLDKVAEIRARYPYPS